MLSAYLQELERGLAQDVSTGEAPAILCEARAHLEESVQARMELGATYSEAQREAIEAFGASRRISSGLGSLSRVRKARLSWLTAYWGLFVSLIVWSASADRSMPDLLVGLLWASLVAVAIGFGLSAFRTGAPAPGSVLKRSAKALLLGTGLMFATHVVYESEGYPQFVGRLKAYRQAEGYRSMAAMAIDGRLRDSTTSSREDIAARYRRWSEELTYASTHPLSNVPPLVSLTAMMGPWIALPPLAFDLVFGSLGWIAHRPRRRRLAIG